MLITLETKLTIVPSNYMHDCVNTSDKVSGSAKAIIKYFFPYLRIGASPKVPFTYEAEINGAPARLMQRRVQVINPNTGAQETYVLLVALRKLNEWHNIVQEGSKI
jgi:hypothetical protein